MRREVNLAPAQGIILPPLVSQLVSVYQVVLQHLLLWRHLYIKKKVSRVNNLSVKREKLRHIVLVSENEKDKALPRGLKRGKTAKHLQRFLLLERLNQKPKLEFDVRSSKLCEFIFNQLTIEPFLLRWLYWLKQKTAFGDRFREQLNKIWQVCPWIKGWEFWKHFPEGSWVRSEDRFRCWKSSGSIGDIDCQS